MSFPIVPLDIAPSWKGLYAREQMLPDEDPQLYADTAMNVEFYGSVIRKRQGSFLLNGVWDTLDDPMHAGATVLPDLNVRRWQDHLPIPVGSLVHVLIWKDGDPHQWTTLTFTITAIDTFGDVTVTPAAPYEIPEESLVMCLPYTEGRRIGGLWQARFRNGAQPLLADTVHTTTGEFKLHLQGNRSSPPFDIFLRMAKTTVVSWGTVVPYAGILTSIEGLQTGDWVYFPTQNLNGRIQTITVATKTIALDTTTQVPGVAAGNAVWFWPNSCPGRISPTRPIGSGKLAASHMGNRSVLCTPGMPPLRYAHTESNTVEFPGTTGPPYTTFRTTTNMNTGNVGRECVISDIGDPDGVGAVYLQKITGIASTTVTISPGIPWQLTAGALVDVVSLSRVGLRAPSTPPTVAVHTPGSQMAPGSYSVRVTYVSRDATGHLEGGMYVESEACQPSNRITVANNGAIDITNIPVPLDPRVTAKRVYRTSAGGDGVWYFTAELTDVTQTSMVDGKNDQSLGALLDEFVNYPPYESMEVVVEWPHAQRLMGIAQIGATAWAVVWSDGPDVLRGQPKPESWPVDNFLFIGLDSGDRPRGIAAFYDSMLIFCERSIWRIQGIPPDLVVEPVNFQQHAQSGIGVASHQAIVSDQNEILFPGPDGVYMIDRYQGIASGFQSQRISRQIDARWDETYISKRNRAHAVFVRSRRQYRLFWPQGFTPTGDPDQAYIYQFDADVDGAPHYWSEWALSRGPGMDTARISCSTVAQPEPADAYLFASINEVCFVGTVEGAILGLDYAFDNVNNGYVDHGVAPFPMAYRTFPFPPSGQLGISSLGRFLHAAMYVGDVFHNAFSVPPATVQLTITAGYEPIQEEALPVNLSAAPVANARFTVGDTVQGLPYSSIGLLRFVLLCRGQYHSIGIFDGPVPHDPSAPATLFPGDRAVELHRMTYFFQRLPEAAVPESYVQVEPTD